MDAKAGTTGETAETAQAEPVSGRSGDDGRAVRVSYQERGFGVALVVDGDREGGGGDAEAGEAGVLRVSDAVVTLEIPLADGGRSVLSWDPAEVTVDPLVA